MELDDFKSAWKSVEDEKHFDQQEIFSMLRKKSSATMKWLFIFTACEFAMLVIYNLYIIISGTSYFVAEISENTTIQSVNNYDYMSYFSLLISFIFMTCAYIYYKRIDLNQSIKDLILSIIQFRKIINLFILFTVLCVLVFSAPFYYELGKSIYLSKHIPLADEVSGLEKLYGWIAIGIALSFIFLIAAIYYTVVYYLFLRQLDRNLKELKEIN